MSWVMFGGGPDREVAQPGAVRVGDGQGRPGATEVESQEDRVCC
ncbi:hypothetical protein [Streptomyces sp. NPDC050264]